MRLVQNVCRSNLKIKKLLQLRRTHRGLHAGLEFITREYGNSCTVDCGYLFGLLFTNYYDKVAFYELLCQKFVWCFINCVIIVWVCVLRIKLYFCLRYEWNKCHIIWDEMWDMFSEWNCCIICDLHEPPLYWILVCWNFVVSYMEISLEVNCFSG